MSSGNLLEEIKSRVDIVEFVSDYIQLRKSGQNYKGLCPFHSEKTPSFMVSQAKQIFHCFGCGAGGDVVGFLMKHDNLSFGEAVRYIAKKAGINTAGFRLDKDSSHLREKILQVNEEAMNFFANCLVASKVPSEYLSKRGLTEESIKKFFIGYASEQRADLFNHLKKAGHVESVLQKAGLVATDGKSFRDSFRRRIIFPILNAGNDVVAFGGRVMDNALPKYINSPETEVFKKSETLFAVNLAKDEIKKKGYALIVEGYLDAIMCHQYGFKNAVAPLGTALTSRHLQRLRLLTDKVVLVFDGDSAGIAAARRSLSIICESSFKAKVILLPEGEDPDSFLRKNGSGPFQKLCGAAQSMIEFLLRTSKSERTDRVREALAVIAGVKDVLLAEEMLTELADRARVNESALRSELERTRKKTGSAPSGDIRRVVDPHRGEEFLLLSAVISFPEKAEAVLSRFNIEDLKEDTVRTVFQRIRELGEKMSVPSLLVVADDAQRALITKLSVDPGFDLELADQNIDDCLHSIACRNFEERKKLADAKRSDDAVFHNSLLEEKRRLIKGANT